MVKYLRSLPFGGCVRGKRWLLEDVRRFLHFLRLSCIVSIPLRTMSDFVVFNALAHSSNLTSESSPSRTRNIVCLESGDTGRPVFFCDLLTPLPVATTIIF